MLDFDPRALPIEFSIPSVDRAEVLRYLGYTRQAITPELDERIDQNIERALAVSRARGCMRIFLLEDAPVLEDPSDALGEKGSEPEAPFVAHLQDSAVKLAGNSMQTYLQDAVAVGIGAVSLGMENERELRKLSLTNDLDHIIFDAASTAVVERAADALEARIVNVAAAQGLYTSYRFSPGYGDLSLDVQPQLLKALDAERKLGVKLSSTLLMSPTKSVSFLVALFDTPQKTSHLSCKGCICYDFCLLRPTGRTCYVRR
ncbi:MAG: hypothetical protein ACOX4F_03365 [Atopobiaceae bacterium]|jgi:hypothetical protein